MSDLSWAEGQPNITAGVENDVILTLADGRVVHVKHDPLSPPDHAWYVLGITELVGHSFEKRDHAVALVTKLLEGV